MKDMGDNKQRKSVIRKKNDTDEHRKARMGDNKAPEV